MSTRRTIFVGDIQGCRVELERLLVELRFDPAADELHPVGDFVNRGPDSAGVLRLCRSLGAGGVLGNHDVLLLRVARGMRRWRERDTAQDVLAASDGEELVAWLGARPLVRSFPGVICVHAALDPRWKDPLAALARLDPLREEPDLSFAISARYCDAHGARPKQDWPAPPPPFRPWHDYWPIDASEKRTVVYGHWARAGLVVKPQVRGLDSGCVWGGKLSAWIAEEDRIVQVQAARAYSEYE